MLYLHLPYNINTYLLPSLPTSVCFRVNMQKQRSRVNKVLDIRVLNNFESLRNRHKQQLYANVNNCEIWFSILYEMILQLYSFWISHDFAKCCCRPFVRDAWHRQYGVAVTDLIVFVLFYAS